MQWAKVDAMRMMMRDVRKYERSRYWNISTIQVNMIINVAHRWASGADQEVTQKIFSTQQTERGQKIPTYHWPELFPSNQHFADCESSWQIFLRSCFTMRNDEGKKLRLINVSKQNEYWASEVTTHRYCTRAIKQGGPSWNRGMRVDIKSVSAVAWQRGPGQGWCVGLALGSWLRARGNSDSNKDLFDMDLLSLGNDHRQSSHLTRLGRRP